MDDTDKSADAAHSPAENSQLLLAFQTQASHQNAMFFKANY